MYRTRRYNSIIRIEWNSGLCGSIDAGSLNLIGPGQSGHCSTEYKEHKIEKACNFKIQARISYQAAQSRINA